MSERMKISTLISTYADGDQIGWEAEFEWLQQHHGGRIRELTKSILDESIHTPILLGNDGRVWDGHHRLYVALVMGFEEVPVEYA